MAIDTRDKRFSFVAFGQSTGVLANPDGSIEAADRAQAIGIYPGVVFPSLYEILQLSSPAAAVVKLEASYQ